jgi:MFS family permease
MSRRAWLVVSLLVLSVVLNYADRSNLSVAVPVLEHQFSITPTRVGELLGAFFWTYALAQVFGLAGWLTDRFDTGWVLFYGFLLWSLATAFTGLATSFVAFFALRLVLGMGESVAYPCYSRIFAALPQEHRGLANSLIDAGTKLGPAAGTFVGGAILIHFGWRMLFVLFGVGSLAWLLPWYFAISSGEPSGRNRRLGENPARDQAPNPAREQAQNQAQPGAGSSIAQILQLRCAWGTFIGHFCGNYFYYFLLLWLPAILVKEEHLSIAAMSKVAAATFLLIAVSTVVAGWITDRLIARGASPTAVRLTAVVGGQATAAILIAFALVRGHPLVALGLIAIACVGQGAYASNHWAIAQTLSGEQMAGRWSSLQNGFANFSGIVAPWVAGFIVQTRGSARLAFVATGGVALLGACSWAFLVRRVEPVDWDVQALKSANP